jgi:SEC-C motif
MPGPGRNELCPCGSNRKVKRCCGQQRGPSEEQLARAHLTLLARDAAADLHGLSDRALEHLWEQLLDVPSTDLSLLVTLPKLIGPDLKRLQEAHLQGRPRLGLGRPHHRRRTDRHPPATSQARRRARPPTRPTPPQSPTSRRRAPRPRQPIHTLHRRQPPRRRRDLSRRRKHPKRPAPRSLTPLIYPGEVTSPGRVSA